MPIGDSVTQPIPAVGTAGTSYAAQLVAFMQEVKARLESKVALTSLVAGLFDLSNNGIGNAKYVGLYEQTSAPTTPVGSIQRYGGELYYVSPSGAVRITNAGSLDVVSANGISGDYASPAEFRYDLGSLEYYAYSDYGASPKKWARIAAQGYDIYGTVNGTTRVRLAWAGGANPSYVLTLPATVPVALSVMQLDSTGAITASNTLPSLVGAVSADYISAHDPTNGFIYFSGTEKTPLSTMLAEEQGGSTHTLAAAQIQFAASTNLVYVPIVGIPVGATLTGLKAWVQKNTLIAYSLEVSVARSINAGALNYPAGLSASTTANGTGNLTMEVTDQAHTVESGYQYWLVIAPPGNVTPSGDKFYHAEIYWNRPEP